MLRKIFLTMCLLSSVSSCGLFGGKAAAKPQVVRCEVLDPGPPPAGNVVICGDSDGNPAVCLNSEFALELGGWLEKVHIMQEALATCPSVKFLDESALKPETSHD